MKKTKFVKYNRTRRDEFQLRTSIIEEDGIPYVEKSALSPAGEAHIRSMADKYRWLKKQNRSLDVVRVELSPDGRTARFDFLTGKSLAEELGETIRDGRVDVQALQEAMDMALDVQDGYVVSFAMTPGFAEVFGETSQTEESGKPGDAGQPGTPAQSGETGQPGTPVSFGEAAQPGTPAPRGLTDLPAFRIANIDCLFENIMLTDQGPCLLDYEWVFDFPVPVAFIRYRLLYYFYEQYRSILVDGTAADFLARFSIGAEEIAVWQEMERHFQDYVHGENQKVYLLNYMHDIVTMPEDMDEIEKKVQETIKHREHLDMEIHERDLTIKKQQEIQRLTDNHVTNLEMMIQSLRTDHDNMAELVARLHLHEAISYKVVRKISTKFNEKFPKGTRKRKILSYTKDTFIHPVKSFRLYTTEEGRNLIEGDLKIGEGYKEHGRLHFPKTENPVVSVVIPVYNQIDYTYVCLVSILEHTEDVPYEVIIADDVSTDATAELSKFVENVTICRNETNQGFLKNCNQAAAAARGKYVMFLNNDTQVTAGWLKSLVDLIESDSSIGMVGSKLVYPDGRLQEAGGILWSDGSGWNYGRLDDPEKPEYNYVKDVDYISGAAIMLSVDLWKRIGGFDERFAPAYCEDSDLAFEVRKAGYRVVYQPLSKVIHYEGISNGTDVNGSGLKRYQVENSKKLKEKWADEFARQCINDGNPDPFRARERSQGKDIILVVDHYVPTYDKDAGSKTTFQYLKMFLEKGYVVKFLGDNFLHEEPYSTALQQMGIEILYGREYQVKIWDWLKEHGDDITIAYLNRPHIATKYVDFIKDNTSIKMIYYGHDLHFLREGREYQLTGDPKKREASDYWKAIEFQLMKKAAVSYYPSYVERDAIQEIDPDIKVKAIVAYVYEKFLDSIPDDFAKREGLLFVGGFAHPPNTDAVLWFAREVFPLIREKLSADFYIVGSKVTEEIKALEQPDNGIIVKGFVSEEELSRLYATCRIVVVPLRYGAGVKGKVIEAIYNGAPIVTTSIGAEGIPQAEDVMCIQDKPEDFAQEVVALYEDTDTCKAMCHKTQDYIREFYSIDAAWKVVGEDFHK